MQRKEYSKMYELEDKHFWFLGKREYVDSLLRAVSLTKIKKILDLGCGTGGMTKYLEKFGEVVGVEKEKYALSLCKKRGLKVILEDAQKLPFKKGEFDLVTIFDVLYHKRVKSEKKVISEAKRVLKKGGILVITDSAFKFLRSNHDEIMHGVRRFRLKNLEETVEKEGFLVIKSSYLYFFIFFPMFFYRLTVGRFSGNQKSDVSKLPKLINLFLLLLIKVEARLLSYISFPFGTSVAIVARKK